MNKPSSTFILKISYLIIIFLQIVKHLAGTFNEDFFWIFTFSYQSILILSLIVCIIEFLNSETIFNKGLIITYLLSSLGYLSYLYLNDITTYLTPIIYVFYLLCLASLITGQVREKTASYFLIFFLSLKIVYQTTSFSLKSILIDDDKYRYYWNLIVDNQQYISIGTLFIVLLIIYKNRNDLTQIPTVIRLLLLSSLWLY
jgi:hypothetical protein